MDPHQRISGLLIGLTGLLALIGIGGTVLPYAILEPLRTLRDLTNSIWSMLFLAWFLLGLVWCALALTGGWRAWQGRADRPPAPAAGGAAPAAGVSGRHRPGRLPALGLPAARLTPTMRAHAAPERCAGA
jgi:hypothetical protein